jgi:hypothetical protein
MASYAFSERARLPTMYAHVKHCAFQVSKLFWGQKAVCGTAALFIFSNPGRRPPVLVGRVPSLCRFGPNPQFAVHWRPVLDGIFGMHSGNVSLFDEARPIKN